MSVPLTNRPRRQIRVVLSSTALLSFMSVRKAAALAVAQLGVAAFFVAGVTRATLGDSAAWFVLAAALVGAFVRAIDIESWALLIPGGAVARVHQAFGARAAKAAAAAGLVERFLLAALACIVIGQYASTVALTAIAGWRLTGYVRPEDFATIVAVFLVGLLWLRARIGLDLTSDRIARAVWIAVGILTSVTVWGLVEPDAWTRVVGDARVAAPGIEHHGLVPDRHRAGVPRRLLAGAAHHWRRRRRCARGARTSAASASGAAADEPARVDVRASRHRVRGVSVRPARAERRTAASGRTLPSRAWRSILQDRGGRAMSCRSRWSGPRHCCWCRRRTSRLSDAEQLLQRLSVEGALSERLAFLHTQVRHAVARHRRRRRRHHPRHVRQRRSRELAGARLCGGDRRRRWSSRWRRSSGCDGCGRQRDRSRRRSTCTSARARFRRAPAAPLLLVGLGAAAMIVAGDGPAIAAVALMGRPLRAVHQGRPRDAAARGR